MIVSFGPAHPAAHGVFRLVLSLSGETVLRSTHTQGLLWRATETLLEYRQPLLSSGYFARLDYVAYVSMELGFSAYRCRSMPRSEIKFLTAINSVANHILNLACTVADSGAVGVILWTFEARELINESVEQMLGYRLHLHLSAIEFYTNARRDRLHHACFTVSELLYQAVVSVRLSRSRLLSNCG